LVCNEQSAHSGKNKETYRLPSAASGKIDNTREVWANVKMALQKGYRGLEGKTSLAKLFKKHKLKQSMHPINYNRKK
jgi:hypothetical protein